MTSLSPHSFSRLALGLLASYFLLGVGAIALSRQDGSIATLWYANTAAIAFLQAARGRQWLQLLLVAGLANALANLCFPGPALLVLSFLPGNLLEIAIGSYALQKACSTKAFLVSPAALLKTLLLVGVLPILLGSAVGAAVLSAYGLAPFVKVWPSWFEGAVTGSLAMLPLAVFLLEGGWARIANSLRRPVLVAALAAMLLAIWFAFTRLPFPWIYVCGLLVLLTLITRWDGAALDILPKAVLGPLEDALQDLDWAAGLQILTQHASTQIVQDLR